MPAQPRLEGGQRTPPASVERDAGGVEFVQFALADARELERLADRQAAERQVRRKPAARIPGGAGRGHGLAVIDAARFHKRFEQAVRGRLAAGLGEVTDARGQAEVGGSLEPAGFDGRDHG